MQRYIFLFQDQGEREDFEATVLFHAPEFCLSLSLDFAPALPTSQASLHEKDKSIVFRKISNVCRKISNEILKKSIVFRKNSDEILKKSIVFRKNSDEILKISNVFAPLAQRFFSFRCHSSK